MGTASPECSRISHIQGLCKILEVLARQAPQIKLGANKEGWSVPEDLMNWPAERQEERIRNLHAAVKGALIVLRAGLDNSLRQAIACVRSSPSLPAAPEKSGLYPFDLRKIMQFPEQRPVFVLGAGRSGTTAIRNALARSPKMFGWNEGHVFCKLFRVLNTTFTQWTKMVEDDAINHNDQVAFYHLNVHDFLNHLVRTVHDLYVLNAARHGAERWLDKTATLTMILTVPLLLHLYPQAKLIFMHRDPIRRTLSRMSPRLQRDDPKSIEGIIFEWVLIMCLWSDLRRHLNPDCYLEIAQPNLSLHTTEVVDRLTPFLGLSTEQAQSVHDYLGSERPQATGTSRDDAEIYVEDAPWPDHVKQWMLDIAQPAARDWGYRLTRDRN